MRQLLILAAATIIAALLVLSSAAFLSPLTPCDADSHNSCLAEYSDDDLEYLFYLPIVATSQQTELYVDNTLVGALCYEVKGSGVPFDCWYYPAAYYYGTFPPGRYRVVAVMGCGIRSEYVVFQPGRQTQVVEWCDE